jgi:hypothetical protein
MFSKTQHTGVRQELAILINVFWLTAFHTYLSILRSPQIQQPEARTPRRNQQAASTSTIPLQASTHLYRAHSGTATARSAWAGRALQGTSKREIASSVRAARRSWVWVMRILPGRSFGGLRSVVVYVAANARRIARRKTRRWSRTRGRSRLALLPECEQLIPGGKEC